MKRMLALFPPYEMMSRSLEFLLESYGPALIKEVAVTIVLEPPQGGPQEVVLRWRRGKLEVDDAS